MPGFLLPSSSPFSLPSLCSSSLFSQGRCESGFGFDGTLQLEPFHWHLVGPGGAFKSKNIRSSPSVGALARRAIGVLPPSNSATVGTTTKHCVTVSFSQFSKDSPRDLATRRCARHITVVFRKARIPGHSSAAPHGISAISGLSGREIFANAHPVARFHACGLLRRNDATCWLHRHVLAKSAPAGFSRKYIHICGDEVIKSNWLPAPNVCPLESRSKV